MPPRKSSAPHRRSPAGGSPGFAVVGIGASAGGLAAFEAFFAGVPTAHPGMAFVLVQHLDPNHKSLLVDLVRRFTSLPVFEAEDGMVVEVDCVYVLPPGKDMAFLHGSLELLEPFAPRGQRLPIDFFFQSLAQDLGDKAVAVVLSGTGSDGTEGVKAVNARGGLVLVQSPQTTDFDGMPRSALDTGVVDFEMAPGLMPGQILASVALALTHPPKPPVPAAPENHKALRKIFVLLRARTGHDFSQYKPSTVGRRIEHRQAVHQIADVDDYVAYLQKTPGEVDLLFSDLLIGVTNFFRDREAFQVLEELALPKLLEGREAGSTIRIWSTGCSTGEEAYSLAMVVREALDARNLHLNLQVFATDIDLQAITKARAGVYPASIASDVSAERLAKFFVPEPGAGYRIRKSIRDVLVFSEQDVVKDPPFSKIDLLVCRNLLIYMGRDLQKRLLPLFHYALNPGGVLFLGSSETVGDFEDLFDPLDRKAKLFVRKEHTQGTRRMPLGQFLPRAAGLGSSVGDAVSRSLPAPSLRKITEQAILDQLTPTVALVNLRGDILYLHGRAGTFLELPSGPQGVNNLWKMIRTEVRTDVGVAFQKAVALGHAVSVPGLRLPSEPLQIAFSVRPLDSAEAARAQLETPLFLVTWSESPVSPDQEETALTSQERVAVLVEALRIREESLHVTSEELEEANQELKSSNEEMQSVNEELQSTNEELETSKEELQAVNEELSTVNTELQTKVADLSRANNDMNNLLAGTGIATVFVDENLNILRFTPAATGIINLIPGDIGRPVAHTVTNLSGYHNLVADSRRVLDTLIPFQTDVQTNEGRWYRLGIQPYRTLTNVIEGVVLSFVDINEIVEKRNALQKVNALLRLAVVVNDSSDAITVQDLTGRTLAWNPGATRLYGWSEDEALAMNVRERIPEPLRARALEAVHRLSLADVLETGLTQRLTKEGTVLEISLTSTALVDPQGKTYAIATTERVRGQNEKVRS